MFEIFKRLEKPASPKLQRVERGTPRVRATIVGFDTSFTNLIGQFVLTRGHAVTRSLLDDLAARLRVLPFPVDGEAEMARFAGWVAGARKSLRTDLNDVLSEWSDLPDHLQRRERTEVSIENKLDSWQQQVLGAGRDLVDAVVG